jgi:Flp pilus assembly protein TadG
MVPVPQPPESGLPANAPARSYRSVADGRWQAGRSREVRGRSAQALIEFALVSLMLLLVLFGVIDFSRAILVREVMVNVSREGANLISRGTDMTNALNALVTSSQPLDISNNGYIILSTVFNSNGVVRTITSQQKRGGKPAASKVGPGGVGSVATLTNPQLPQTNQTLWVAEVFYTFTPVTPLGRLLGLASLSSTQTLYDAAFF